jgi:hypothetical protein
MSALGRTPDANASVDLTVTELLATGPPERAVVPDGQQGVGELADDHVTMLGRTTVGLVLRQTHADVDHVLLRGRRQLDGHRRA